MNISDSLFVNGEQIIKDVKFIEVRNGKPDVLKSWFIDGVLPIVGQKVDLVCTHADESSFCISLKVSQEAQKK